MEKKFLVNRLIDAGLTASEARVYYYLLKKKDFTATEIAKLSGVHRSKIYDVLTQLIKKGLCTETLGKVKKYSPVNPNVGFDNLHDELEMKKKYLNDLSKLLSPLYLTAKDNTDPLDYVKVLRDKKTITNSFNKLEEQATKEVLSFVKGPFVMDISKMIKQLEEITEFDSLTKGVVYKTIHEEKDLQDKIFFKGVEFFVKAGEETRILTKLHLPFKMYVFDEKIAMFTLEDKLTDEKSITSLIIEHPDLAKGLKMIFYIYWQNAIPFEEFKVKEKI